MIVNIEPPKMVIPEGETNDSLEPLNAECYQCGAELGQTDQELCKDCKQ